MSIAAMRTVTDRLARGVAPGRLGDQCTALADLFYSTPVGEVVTPDASDSMGVVSAQEAIVASDSDFRYKGHKVANWD